MGRRTEKEVAWHKEWAAKNKERIRAYRKGWNEKNKSLIKSKTLLKRYGITIEVFNELIASQNGACALCDKVFDLNNPKLIHIDHCHDTGKIRGALCSVCNTTKVGSNTIETAKKLLDYLTKNR